MTAQRCRLTPLKSTLFFKARLLCSVMIVSGLWPKYIQAQSVESAGDTSQWHVANLSGSLAFLMPSFIPRLSVWGYGGVQGTLHPEQAACGLLGIEPQYHLGKIKVFGSGQFLTKTVGLQNNHYPCGQISLGGDFFNWVQLRASLRKPFIGKSANEGALFTPLRACISECLATGWILKRFGLYGLGLWGGNGAWKDIVKMPKQIGVGLQCIRFLDISAICYLNGSLQSLVKKSSYGLRISLIGAFGRHKKYQLSAPYMLRFGHSMGTYFEKDEARLRLDGHEIEAEESEYIHKVDDLEDLTTSTTCYDDEESLSVDSEWSAMVESTHHARRFSRDSGANDEYSDQFSFSLSDDEVPLVSKSAAVLVEKASAVSSSRPPILQEVPNKFISQSRPANPLESSKTPLPALKSGDDQNNSAANTSSIAVNQTLKLLTPSEQEALTRVKIVHQPPKPMIPRKFNQPCQPSAGELSRESSRVLISPSVYSALPSTTWRSPSQQMPLSPLQPLANRQAPPNLLSRNAVGTVAPAIGRASANQPPLPLSPLQSAHKYMGGYTLTYPPARNAYNNSGLTGQPHFPNFSEDDYREMVPHPQSFQLQSSEEMPKHKIVYQKKSPGCCWPKCPAK